MPPVTAALQQQNNKLSVKNANNYSWIPVQDIKMYVIESFKLNINKQV
jgi:hypothetical protein|tara:strand:- start:227 stop:370 length:144 start_codon:yes stop_codon:yes gene_type:complete